MRVRVQKLVIVSAVALVSMQTGCTHQVWTKAEVTDWTNDWVRPPKQLWYCGSDARFHHFVARPIDSYVYLAIPRSELQLQEVIPYNHNVFAATPHHYPVDVNEGFKRVEPTYRQRE